MRNPNRLRPLANIAAALAFTLAPIIVRHVQAASQDRPPVPAAAADPNPLRYQDLLPESVLPLQPTLLLTLLSTLNQAQKNRLL